MLSEERREALRSELRGRLGSRVALHEGERDCRIDVGEDGSGAGPKAVEQRAELVRERDALGDEIITSANERTKSLQGVGLRREWAEAVAVRPQHVREEIRVAAIVLATGGAIARTARLHDVGMDRHDDVASIDERIDDETRRPLDCDRDLGGGSELREPCAQLGEPASVVRDLELPDDLPSVVDHANRVASAAPVQPSEQTHSEPPSGRSLRAGRPCGTLTDWRSGRQPLARLPVARRGLPAPPTQRVSSGPSSGQRCKLSWEAHGREGTAVRSIAASSTREVHQ